MKYCKDCETAKPLADFGPHKSTADGRNTYCRPCEAVRMRLWRAKNLERVQRAAAEHHLLTTYGITRAEYDALFEAQDGRCALCLRSVDEIAGRVRVLCVDHDHTTGQVRGRLCRICNAALHPIESYAGWVERARAYLSE